MGRREMLRAGLLGAAVGGAGLMTLSGRAAATHVANHDYVSCVNVKDPQYGAFGNGTVDDTAAIQNALNAASVAAKSTYLPAGIYLVGPLTVPLASRVFGENPGGEIATFFKAKAGAFVPDVDALCKVDAGGVTPNAGIDAVFENLGFWSPAGATDTNFGIKLTGGVNAIVRNCDFTGWKGTLSQRGRGLTVTQNPSTGPPFGHVVVDSCRFEDNQIGVVPHRTNMVVEASLFNDNLWDGIYGDGGDGELAAFGNTFRGNGRTGILLFASKGARMRDNYLWKNWRSIDLTGDNVNPGASRCVVSGNYSENPTSTETNAGHHINLEKMSRQNLIAYNSIEGGGPNVSIEETGIRTGTVSDMNELVGNVINGCRKDGIFLGSGKCVVEGNVCFDNNTQTPPGTNASGIRIQSSDNLVQGNRCFDTRAVGSKTQSYGINEDQTGSGENAMLGNWVKDNKTAGLRLQQTGAWAKDNPGYNPRGLLTNDLKTGTNPIVTGVWWTNLFFVPIDVSVVAGTLSDARKRQKDGTNEQTLSTSTRMYHLEPVEQLYLVFNANSSVRAWGY